MKPRYCWDWGKKKKTSFRFLCLAHSKGTNKVQLSKEENVRVLRHEKKTFFLLWRGANKFAIEVQHKELVLFIIRKTNIAEKFFGLEDKGKKTFSSIKYNESQDYSFNRYKLRRSLDDIAKFKT